VKILVFSRRRSFTDNNIKRHEKLSPRRESINRDRNFLCSLPLGKTPDSPTCTSKSKGEVGKMHREKRSSIKKGKINFYGRRDIGLNPKGVKRPPRRSPSELLCTGVRIFLTKDHQLPCLSFLLPQKKSLIAHSKNSSTLQRRKEFLRSKEGKRKRGGNIGLGPERIKRRKRQRKKKREMRG